MILKNKCLVLLFKPEQKPNKDPPMIVIPSAPIAQNAMLYDGLTNPQSLISFVKQFNYLLILASVLVKLFITKKVSWVMKYVKRRINKARI